MSKLQEALITVLKEERAELTHLTQEELSGRSGVSRATIANIERGRQAVTIDTLYKLSRALELDAGTLLNKAINIAYPAADKAVILSDVDNKQEILDTLSKYI